VQADWALSTGHAISTHTGPSGECADAIETGVGADGSARIRTGTGSGGLGETKGRKEAAYVMPGWANTTASI